LLFGMSYAPPLRVRSAYEPANLRQRTAAHISMAQHVVHVRPKAWKGPNGGKRSCWLEATSDAGDVGGCGLEVAELDADGLRVLHSKDGVRPRAVVSGTLFVHRRFRRQGIAQRLLREAETQARWWGCAELRLLVKQANTPARRLYKKMGYVEHEQTSSHGSEICMSRKLFMPNLHTLLSVAPQMQTVGDGEDKSKKGGTRTTF